MSFGKSWLLTSWSEKWSPHLVDEKYPSPPSGIKQLPLKWWHSLIMCPTIRVTIKWLFVLIGMESNDISLQRWSSLHISCWQLQFIQVFISSEQHSLVMIQLNWAAWSWLTCLPEQHGVGSCAYLSSMELAQVLTWAAWSWITCLPEQHGVSSHA